MAGLQSITRKGEATFENYQQATSLVSIQPVFTPRWVENKVLSTLRSCVLLTCSAEVRSCLTYVPRNFGVPDVRSGAYLATYCPYSLSSGRREMQAPGLSAAAFVDLTPFGCRHRKMLTSGCPDACAVHSPARERSH